MPRSYCPCCVTWLRAGLVAALIVPYASAASGTVLVPVTGTSATGRAVAFTAGMTVAGDELLLTLANVSPVDSRAAADVLSSFYFDIRRGAVRPPLVLAEAGGFVFRVRAGRPDEPEFYTPQTFVNEAGRVSDLVARNRGDATWLFREMDPDEAPFLGFGIGTVGNSGLAPNSFNPHVVGPPGNQMINFSIFAGTDIDPVGVLDGTHLVHREIVFRFTGAAGYGEADIVDLYAFGLGTGPDSLITVSLPEPGGLAVSVIGMLALLLTCGFGPVRSPGADSLHAAAAGLRPTPAGRSARPCRW